jgi:hypothetical protein
MNLKDLNSALVALIETRQELQKINYSDERYDELEEALHDMEDAFNDQYGPFMEDVLEEVHERVCPDTDVLLPTAYLPEALKNENGFMPSNKDGVWVEADQYPDKEARLALVPNPPRLILSVGKNVQEEVWKA